MKCLSLTILVWGLLVASLAAQTSTTSGKYSLNQASHNASNTSMAQRQLLSNTSTTAQPTGTTVFNTGVLPVVSFTTTNVSCNGAADGCATAVVSGSTGNLGYLWSNGATTSNICGLGPGLYTVTVTDTMPAGPPNLDTLYFEDFEATHNWNLAVSTGASGATPNVWAVNDSEGGVAPTGCGVGNNGDNTMHITCTSLFCGSLITGAVYNATQESNVRTESPVFSTVGYSNINFTFDYIANGDGLNDNASVLYNDGSGWQVLDPSLKSPICITGQGEWTAYSVTLPASCDNNPTVQIGFNWTNNADNIGTDPSIAINNTLLTSMGTGGANQICTVVNDTTIVQPVTLVLNIDTIAPVVCTGNNNGFINTSTSGGTTPYTYNWSNGAVTANISNLVDSMYYVTLTDANGCIVIDSANVITLGAIQITLDSTVDVSCNGDSTGAIYTTVITDTISTSCASSVVAINEFLYDPLVRDGQNPYTGEYIELIGPPGADISCYVLTDGDWTITLPAGSTIPPDGFFTIGNDSIWGAGTFDVDAENCNCFTDGAGGEGLLILTNGGEYFALYDNTGTFLEGVIYGSPTMANTPSPGAIINTLGAPGCPTSVTMPSVAAFETAPGGVGNDVSLIRDPDGSGAWVPQIGGSLGACNNPSATSGSNNVTYLWSNGDTTQDISNLPAGTYTVTATNAYGCATTTTYTVTEPAVLTATTLATDIACVGDTTGAIDLTVAGGTTPYTFNWSNGATTEDLGMLLSGNYCVTVTDSSGCTAIACDTIEEPFFNIPVDTFYICAGDSVQIQVNTNITNLSWTPAGSLSNDTIANPFASPINTTTYVVSTAGTVCTTMDSIVVIVDSVDLNLASINPLCNGDTTGSITTVTTNTNYTYLWNTGDTTASLTNIGAGAYQLTVSSGSCQDTFSVILTEPAVLTATTIATDIACVGDTTGAIDLTITGGTMPYSFNWSNGAITEDLSMLLSGNYCVTVTDDNACTITVCDTIEEPFFTIPVDTFYICVGDSVQIQVNTNITNLSWTPAGSLSNDTINNPFASPINTTTYVVSTIGTACTTVDSIIVIVDSVNASLATVNPLCNGDTTGSIITTTTGSNYNYLWNTGDTTANLTNVGAGTYMLTVSSGACQDTLSAILIEPTVLALNLSSSTDPSCNGDTTGAIVITNSGGTLPYTYSWSNGTSTQNLNNVSAGLYNLTLTDDNGCTAPLSVVLTEPSAISVSYSATNVSCGGSNDGTATVLPTGGTPGYTYLWDVTASNQTTATATNLSASTYSVTITDLEGCTAEANGIFVNPGIPVDSNDVPLAIVTGLLDCALNPIGALEINTVNNYTYLWSNGETSRSVTNLPAGSYSVTVTNGLGCTYVQTATVNSPFVPTVNPFILNAGLTATTVTAGTSVDINGGNDQSFQGVTYNWTSTSTAVDITTATAHATTAMSTTTGTYLLTITATAADSTACQDTASVTLNVESVYIGMPNAFTPNEDGVNDLYRPVGLNAADITTFRVYNRWGQEVYNGDDLENMGWDGRFQGAEQPTEVYIFVLEYKIGASSETEVHKGEFSLVR